MSVALLNRRISPSDIGGLFYTLCCFPQLEVDFRNARLPSKRRERPDELIVGLLLPFGCDVTFSQLHMDLIRYCSTCGMTVRGNSVQSKDGLICKFVFEI